MTEGGPVDVTVDAGVAVVRFGLADGVTTLTAPLAHALDAALSAVAARDDARTVVLTGRGRAFVAGADVKAMRAATVDDNLRMNRALTDLGHAVAAYPLPLVCALNGHAFGGGLELALAATLRVADARASLGLPETTVGLIPGSGGLLRLPALVGRSRAAELVLTGRPVGADEALRIGLVDAVAAAGEAEADAVALARTIAANAPLAVREALSVLREIEGEARGAATGRVHGALDRLLRSGDMARGIDAFLAHRAPQFEGR